MLQTDECTVYVQWRSRSFCLSVMDVIFPPLWRGGIVQFNLGGFAWLGKVEMRSTPNALLCYKKGEDFLSTLIFSRSNGTICAYPWQRPTPKQQHWLTQISNLSVLGGNLKHRKQPHQEYLLPQDLMVFQDPVCPSSLQILGSKGETFLKLDPFVTELRPLREHFAK